MIAENASQPFFSVIIPTYNRGSFITETINSVLQQHYTSFEILVIDDGSTDNTRQIIDSFNDRRIRYFYKENGERGAARNFGILQARGAYVTFLDSDDLLRPDHLSTAFHCIQTNNRWTVFHLGYDVILPDGEILYPWKRLPDPVNRRLVEGNFLSCLGIFVKRQIIEEHKFIEDRELAGSEDYELWLRIAARHPIHTSAAVTACLVNHETRSVLNFSATALKRRIAVLKAYISKDHAIRKFYGTAVKTIYSFLDLYLALHLVLSSHRVDGMKTLWKAFTLHPKVVFNYRFWVVIKKVLV
jgi:glycosyltransferase involved in cell wall biosynthesis